jgi:hypothetical protein
MSFALIKARASAVGFEESYIELALPVKFNLYLFIWNDLFLVQSCPLVSHVYVCVLAFVYVCVCAHAHPFARIISEGVDGLTDIWLLAVPPAILFLNSKTPLSRETDGMIS